MSSVNFGDDEYCNAYFLWTLRQMLYGNPCVGPGGAMHLTTPDIAAHEFTHGVTDNTAGLIYSGQSGALNESFSDYLGNVIGNAYQGRDDDTIGETGCAKVTQQQALCDPSPDGGFATRYLPNGAGFDDYLGLLNVPLGLLEKGVGDQDGGGVHLNSAIWNNALWSIRKRLVQIDGSSGVESPLAADFDAIVFHALSTQLSPTSGFIDARRAVEQTIVDAGADPVVGRVAREVFEANDFCAGCGVGPVAGEVVAGDSSTDLAPVVNGDQVAWTTLGDGVLGVPSTGSAGEASRSLVTAPETATVAFAGNSIITLEFVDGLVPGDVVRYDTSGSRTVLGPASASTTTSGLAGSEVGAAWVSAEAGTVSFVDPEGQVVVADLPPAFGADNVTAVAVADGFVALGTEGGRLVEWQPGGGFTDIGRMPSTVLALARQVGASSPSTTLELPRSSLRVE